MPYVLSWNITEDLPGLWKEDSPYSVTNIYDINSSDPRVPPVHYNSYTLKPHSLTHVDAPAHIIPGGKVISDFYSENQIEPFYGEAYVLKFRRPKWDSLQTPLGKMKFWRISKEDLQDNLHRLIGTDRIPDKLIISLEELPLDERGNHDERHALVLDREAAAWLISNPRFNLLGTSWKSTDFQPESRERPIHKTILSQAIIFECLDLKDVPEGRYFFSGFPLPLAGASEAPVVPVLFKESELRGF